MAVRAQKMGMRVMINFHYSDSWADPQQQRKPAAWIATISRSCKGCLCSHLRGDAALKQAGVTPEWVQVGNETRTGMIYPEGHTDNWPQLAKLINQGYDAVKAVSPSSKVVLHLDRGQDNAWFRTWSDNAKANGAKYDVIGCPTIRTGWTAALTTRCPSTISAITSTTWRRATARK
jgi:arabinogalactan endo-1,4-beta-galactosidase